MAALPAILAVRIGLACSLAGQAASVDPPPAASPPIAEGPVRVDPAVSFRVRLAPADGGRSERFESGPWSGFGLDGLFHGSSILAWTSILPPDRLRAGRHLLDRAGMGRDPAATAYLAVALGSISDDEIARRAFEEASALAGERSSEVRAAIAGRVAEERRRREDRRRAEEAVAMESGRPHLHVDDASIPVTVDPALVAPTIESQRRRLDDAIDGSGLEVVPTGLSIVAASGSLEEVSRVGVRLDRLVERCARTAGLPLGARPFTGSLVLVAPKTEDDARLLLATLFDREWPQADASVLVQSSSGPWAIVRPPSAMDLSALVKAGLAEDEDAARTLWRHVEEARVAARAVLLNIHGGRRVPAWLIEGFAEAAAASLVPGSPVELVRRPRAIDRIRRGLSSSSLLGADPDGPDFGEAGAARDLSLVLVQRLLERDSSTFPGLVADLKGGRDLDTAFRRRTGLGLEAWLSDSDDWFLYND